MSGFTTVEYSSSGAPLWTDSWSGGNQMDIAVDNNDNVVVVGWPGAGSYLATVKYALPWPPLVSVTQATNDGCHLRVDRVLLDCTAVIEVSTNLTA